jgi:hypothetical protein
LQITNKYIMDLFWLATITLLTDKSAWLRHILPSFVIKDFTVGTDFNKMVILLTCFSIWWHIYLAVYTPLSFYYCYQLESFYVRSVSVHILQNKIYCSSSSVLNGTKSLKRRLESCCFCFVSYYQISLAWS